jgi:hypothetical protein
MAVPHYIYLVLKMPGPNGVITIRGDLKMAYECDYESCNLTDTLITSLNLNREVRSLAESPADSVMSESKTSKLTIQLEEKPTKTVQLDPTDPSMVIHIWTNLDLK